MSKIVALLASFDRTELRRFQEFVSSPFFNKNKALIALLNHLITSAPDFAEEKTTKASISKALFPTEPFDKRRITYLLSYLLKLGEQFLATTGYLQDESLVKCHVLRQYVDRQLYKHYHYLVQKTREKIETSSKVDGKSYYQKYLLSQVEVDHFYSQQIRKFDPSLQKVSDQLDNFYFFQKLRYSCEMLNRQALIAADYRLTFMEEVNAFLQKEAEIDPLIDIYLQIYLSISRPEEEHYFEKLIRLIEMGTSAFSQKTQREIYLYAINYCAPKIRKRNEKYTSIMFDLYKKGIENHVLFDDEDYLSHWTYTNVVRLGLRLKHYDWVAKFITENAIHLPPQVLKDAEHYNLAELYYHQKDFDSVLDHLGQLQFSDLQYHLGSRVILLKTYYEQESFEPLVSLLASFSIYLRRNKQISLPVQKTYLNFCNMLHQLLRTNPRKWDTLGAKIKEIQPLAESVWLLEMWNRKARESAK